MGIFASKTTATVGLPMDVPQTVTIRKLTGKEIEAAQVAHRGSILTDNAKAWGGAFRRMLEKGANDPEVLKALADPLTGYDRFVVLKAGLVGWSYGEKVDPAQVNDLDDESVDFIATEILRLTKPALFVAPEAVEDANTQPSAAARTA